MNEEEKAKINLDAPFSLEAQHEENVEVAAPEVKAEEPVEEESRVPLSRLDTMRRRALEASEEAAYWRGQAEAKTKEAPFEEPTQMPSWWIETYGNNEAAQKMWELDQKRTSYLKEQVMGEARKEATETLRREREEEVERLSDNESLIEENLENLTDVVGRKLTSSEEDSILDIVDEYTPKDAYGNYAGPTIPFDKAWEIHELRQGRTKQPTNAARQRVANIVGERSKGDVTQAEEDKNWNPLNWRARIDKIKD